MVSGIKELSKNEVLTITNFGTFESRNQGEKVYRDVRSGELMKSPAKRRLVFTQSRNIYKGVPDEDSRGRDSKH